MTIEEILAKQARGEEISKDEVNYLITALSKAVAGKVPEGEKSASAQDFVGELTAALDAVRRTPEGQAQIRDAVAGRKEQRFIKRYSPFFDAILAGADVMTSLSQIKESKQALAELKRPGMPAIPGIDPALDNAIRGAERGTMDGARLVAPARQELQDQYAKDIAMAKAVGGGQASTVGAMSQVASMRRARGAANLIPMMDSVQAREQARLDSLIGQRMQQRNQNYYNRARQSQLNLDQYNQDVTAAGQLGSVARMNLRNSAQSLLNQAPRVMSRINTGYNDKYSVYEQQLNDSLVRPQYGSSHFVQPQYNQFYNPFQNSELA